MEHGPLIRRGGVDGLIELARRVARGFINYDNYRLRILLAAGGLDSTTPA